MLGSFLPRKVQVSRGSTPSLSCTSSSSSNNSGNGSLDGVSLVPLTTTATHEDEHHRHHHARLPEPSLRQRNTGLASHNGIMREDDDSNSSDDDDSKGNVSPPGSSNPSVLRSVLGASPFLMGPHIFSPSEFSQPARLRKEDLQKNVDKNPKLSNGNTTLYRRGAPQSQSSPLMASSHGSSFSDVDLEVGEMNGYSVEEVAPLVSSSSKRKQTNYQKKYAFVLRSRESVIIHFLMEARMLQSDLMFILFVTFYQLFHSTVTNVAYYQHAQLNAANRVPLRDVAFDMLPPLDGELWIVSEYILYAILTVSISCIVSNLIVRWNAPHGRPIYCIQIIRRLGMTWIVCQTLRMISFMVTTLPGASRQCRYTVPVGLTSEEMINGPAPNEGNPAGWAPPTDLNDILFRVDASNGCGDLMFSSHTIYTMSFVCVIFKYFNFRWLKLIMATLQIAIVPFILAARKHYTVDVFTALYVTPLVFEILWTRFPDRDTSLDLAQRYGIRFYLAQEGHDTFNYVVSVWGREFYVDPEQLPVDIRRNHHNTLSVPCGKGGESSRPSASIVKL